MILAKCSKICHIFGIWKFWKGTYVFLKYYVTLKFVYALQLQVRTQYPTHILNQIRSQYAPTHIKKNPYEITLWTRRHSISKPRNHLYTHFCVVADMGTRRISFQINYLHLKTYSLAGKNKNSIYVCSVEREVGGRRYHQAN